MYGRLIELISKIPGVTEVRVSIGKEKHGISYHFTVFMGDKAEVQSILDKHPIKGVTYYLMHYSE